MDYFFWGVLKDNELSKKPRNRNEMAGFIHEACQEIVNSNEPYQKV